TATGQFGDLDGVLVRELVQEPGRVRTEGAARTGRTLLVGPARRVDGVAERGPAPGRTASLPMVRELRRPIGRSVHGTSLQRAGDGPVQAHSAGSRQTVVEVLPEQGVCEPPELAGHVGRLDE